MRIGGLVYHEPFMHNHDELSFIETALRFGKLDFEPFTFSHAYFLYIILFLEYAVFFLIKKIIFFNATTTASFIADYLKNPALFIYIGRITIFLCGVGVVYLIYRISKNLFGKKVARISGFISAFTFGLVQLTSSIKADIPSIFFLLLSLFLATEAIRRVSKRHLFLAFFMTGIAVSTKFHTILGLFFLVAITLLYFNKNKSLFFTLACGFGLTLFGIAIGCPYILIKPVTILQDTIFRLGKQYIMDKTITFPLMFHIKYHLRNLMGIPLELASIAGIVYAILKHKKQDIILISFIVPFMAIFFNSIGFAYHLLPVLPFMIILSSRFLVDMTSRLKRRAQEVVLVLLTLIIIYPTFIDSVKWNIYLNSKDTRVIFKEWVEGHMPQNTEILMEGAIAKIDTSTVSELEPNLESLTDDLTYIEGSGGTGYLVEKRIALLKERLKKNEDIKVYNIKKAKFLTRDLMEDAEPAYVVVNGLYDIDYGEHTYQLPLRNSENREEIRKYLDSNYSLVKRFRPTIKISGFPSLFINNDYRNLRSTSLQDIFNIVKGPELTLYRRK